MAFRTTSQKSYRLYFTYHLSTYRRGKCQNSNSRLFPACTTIEKRESFTWGLEKRNYKKKMCTSVLLWCQILQIVPYSSLSSVIFIEDVEGYLLGDSSQQTGRMQVSLEAEQPVDPPFRIIAGRRGAAAQPCCAHKHTDAHDILQRIQHLKQTTTLGHVHF